MNIWYSPHRVQRALLGFAMALFFAFQSATTHAQTFPNRPVRLIVPFPPGGPNDVISRLVADGMREALGHPVVIDNRAGAAGTIGADAGAKAPADGYTLTLGSTSTHSLPTLLGQKIPYDPQRSFAPVGLIGLSPTVLVVSNKLPVKDIQGFIDFARKNPGRLSYASSGVGTLAHLAAESFKLETQTFIVHVPYRGTGQAMTDLISGQIDMMFDAVVTARTQTEAGNIKALAIAGKSGINGMGNLPTLDQAGLKKFDASLWLGLFAPAGTPAEALDKLNAALAKTLRSPGMEEKLLKIGVVPTPGSAKELTQYMQETQAYWRKTVQARGIKLDQ
jgi:tripartite-type tricarboxylate transporter receptor subunit TctC